MQDANLINKSVVFTPISKIMGLKIFKHNLDYQNYIIFKVKDNKICEKNYTEYCKLFLSEIREGLKMQGYTTVNSMVFHGIFYFMMNWKAL